MYPCGCCINKSLHKFQFEPLKVAKLCNFIRFGLVADIELVNLCFCVYFGLLVGDGTNEVLLTGGIVIFESEVFNRCLDKGTNEMR